MASELRGLLAYGSLIHPNEHRKLPGLINTLPVRVRGYRRIFHQAPSWRKGQGTQIAVLDAVPSPADSINALCLILTTEALSVLAQRERGYKLETVPLSDLSFCTEIDSGEFPEIFVIYRGKEGLQRDDILPNPDYLQLCREGARFWGKEFHKMFLKSTYCLWDSATPKPPLPPQL